MRGHGAAPWSTSTTWGRIYLCCNMFRSVCHLRELTQAVSPSARACDNVVTMRAQIQASQAFVDLLPTSVEAMGTPWSSRARSRWRRPRDRRVVAAATEHRPTRRGTGYCWIVPGIQRSMSAKTIVVTATMVASAGLGLATNAQAQPDFAQAPPYHWCPGEAWLQGWGFNWEWAECHDNTHRDVDGDNHVRDWHGPPPPGVTPHPPYPAGVPGGPPPAVWWSP